MMNSHIKKRWVEALTSGDYLQSLSYLKILNDDGNYEYCCLGVLVDLLCQGKDWNNSDEGMGIDRTDPSIINLDDDGYPKTKHLRYAGLSNKIALELATMNDDGVDFDEIAGWIERHL